MSVILQVSVVICTVKLPKQFSALILQPREPAPSPAPLFLTLSSLDIYFSFVFVLQEPTVKRARAHTDAALYVSRVFELFIL